MKLYHRWQKVSNDSRASTIGAMMQNHYLTGLERGISAPRLSVYGVHGSLGVDAIINYFWNIALSEALYPELDALEIVLRNSIHDAATSVFGTEMWFDLTGVLKLGQPRQVQKAKRMLRVQHKPQTAGRIIAELRFGFWTSLLSGPYHSSFWMPQKARLLKTAFPNMTNAERIRSNLHDRYDHIRLLRNRVFHYEPIWNRPDLLRVHAQIIEAIGWINPSVRDSILLLDRFDDIFRQGRARIASVSRPSTDRSSVEHMQSTK